MSTASYIRFICRFVKGIAVAVFALVIVMVGTTVADCSMKLGWGWDCNLSVPIVCLIAVASVVVFAGSHLLERMFLRLL